MAWFVTSQADREIEKDVELFAANVADSHREMVLQMKEMSQRLAANEAEIKTMAARLALVAANDEADAKANEEKDEEELDPVARWEAMHEERVLEDMHDNWSGSYYGYVLLMLVSESTNPSCGSSARQMMLCMMNFLFGIFLLFLQITTSWAIVNALNQTSAAMDDDIWVDKFAPGGSDDPHSFTFVYLHKFMGMPFPTFVVLLFSYLMLGGNILSELRQMVISFTFLKCSFDDVQPGIHPKVIFFCGHVFHFIRICMIISFCISLMFLVGLSDGPFNILLNSLASAFILETDDALGAVLSAVFVRPSETRLIMEDQMKRKCDYLANYISEKKLRGPMEIAVWGYFTMFAVFVPVVFQLQRRQSSGNLNQGAFMLSDDTFYTITIFELCVPLALISCILVNVNLTWRSARSGGFLFHAVMVVVVESICFIVLFYGAILCGIQLLALSGRIGFCFHGWHANRDGTALTQEDDLYNAPCSII